MVALAACLSSPHLAWALSAPVLVTVASMSRTSVIDTLQDDRGLQSCLAAANIKPEWSTPFLQTHGIETLDDYVFMVNATKSEESILALVQAAPAVKDNRVALSRFKAAFESGQQAIKNAASVTSKGPDSLDEVLPESTLSTVNRDFTARYGIEVETALEPADALRSRLYREFRKATMSVVEIKKVKSMLTQASPRLQQSVQLPGGLQLQFDKDAVPEVTSTVHYYFGLRVLAYGWAWAGNFKFKDHDAKERLFISLSAAQAYADNCLWATVEYGQGQLAWLTRNDTLTRGKMASLIRRGWSGGEALREALHLTHLEWRAPSTFIAKEPEARKRPPEPALPPPEPKRIRDVKSDKHRTVSMIKGGKKLCKKFNDSRGCSTHSCPDLHVCDVKLPDGRPCMSRNHNRLGHDQE